MKKILFFMATLLAGLFLSACSSELDDYKDLNSISGSAVQSTLALGQSTDLKVTARYADGSTKDVTSECTFELRGDASNYLSLNGSKVTVIKAENVQRSEGVIFYYKKNVGSILLKISPNKE